MIVIDASALLDLLLRSPQMERLQRRLFTEADRTVCAPHLIDIEVTQALRRYARSGEISDERGREALADLADLPIRRYPHTALLPRIWELRNNVTAYDAVYVALAEALDAVLLTRDRRLATAAKGHVHVEAV